MTISNQNTLKSQFDEFAFNEGMNIKKDASGGYQARTTHLAYLAWLASYEMYRPEIHRKSKESAYMTESPK